MEAKMAHVIGCINKKGGVAKTTMTHAIGRELSKKYRVLLIDFDGQASLTDLFDLKSNFDEEQLSDYFKNNSLLNIFTKKSTEPLDVSSMITKNESCADAKVKALHLLPSPGYTLGNVAESVVGGKELMLKKYINKIKDDYDFIIIDSLPSVSTLFINVLLASDSLLMPIETKYMAFAGSNEFISLIDDISENYDIEYENLFLLPTKHNKQRMDDKDVLAEIKTDFIDFIESCNNISKTPVTLLKPIPERSVFSNAQAVGYFPQEYIECFDKGKRDILLLLENTAKKIRKKCLSEK
jgi:chromosome partitioning protein